MYKTSIGFLILKHQNLFSLSPFPSPFHFPPAKGIRTFYTCTLQFENFYSVLQSGTLLKARSAVELIQKQMETTTYPKFSSSLPSSSSIKVAVVQELSGLLKKKKKSWVERKKREGKKRFIWERSHMVWKRPHSEILIDFYKRTHTLLQPSWESLLYMGKIKVAQLECLNVHFMYIFSFHPNIPTR